MEVGKKNWRFSTNILLYFVNDTMAIVTMKDGYELVSNEWCYFQ